MYYAQLELEPKVRAANTIVADEFTSSALAYDSSVLQHVGTLCDRQRRPGILFHKQYRHAGFNHAHAGEGTRKLKGAGEAAINDLVRSEPVERAALEQHTAPVGANKSGQQIEHCRLAGSVRPQDAGNRARLQNERHVSDSMQATETLVQLLHFEQCTHAKPDRRRRHSGATMPCGRKNKIIMSTRV